MNWKTIFCNHIWKTISDEFDHKTRHYNGGEKWGCPTYSNYFVFISKKECVKCGKTEWYEHEHIDFR